MPVPEVEADKALCLSQAKFVIVAVLVVLTADHNWYKNWL